MEMTPHDMQRIMREWLGVSPNATQLEQDRAVLDALVEIGLEDFNTDAEKSHALFQVLKAEDMLDYAESENINPGQWDRIGPSQQLHQIRLMEKATKLNAALGTPEGKAALLDIQDGLKKFGLLNTFTVVSTTSDTTATPQEELIAALKNDMDELVHAGETLMKTRGWTPAPHEADPYDGMEAAHA